jgi:DNA (cytosine-5)-methyltransferase 1
MKLKTIDLFAGIGGIRTGFKNSFKENIEFVFSSEIDKFAKISYEENYGEKPEGDITKIKEEDIPKHDILLGGFPCQAFSIAGKKLGFNETRGTLFFEIERILKHHKPKVIFLENVKGLLSHDKGNTFKVIKENLEKIGYKLHYKVLNAKNYGLPQNRDRIFIVGFLDHSINFEFPKELNKKTKLGDILFKEVPEKYTLSDRLWNGHKRRKEEHSLKGNGFGYKIFDENSEYTSTISARYYKDGSEILIAQENKNPRKLIPREAARLQGFPDTFKIVVSDVQAYKQFGNSVAVNVIEEIAKQIKLSLK